MKIDVKNLKKKIRNLLILFAVMLFIIFLLLLIDERITGKSQIMDKLNYDVVLHENGSATITETWDVYISHTNTLFRNFTKKGSSFGDIVDVTVKDLDTGKYLYQIDQEMYHVTTDCYYALYINSRQFEIAWGTGMEKSIGKKKYEISYTVTDVVNSYKDCEEFYWKLLSEENAIPVKKVTGTITMPKSVSEIGNLKVWGHGPLNGIINIVSNNQMQFSIDNLNDGRMLEVRAVSTEDMFNVVAGKIRNYSYLDTIVEEESEWANESNVGSIYFAFILIAIYIVAIIINIVQIIKFYKISKQKDDGIVHKRLKYFRDIPRDGSSTPPEAAYLYYFNKSNKNIASHQADIVSSTILNLAYKGYIKLRTEDKKVYVSVIKDDNGLNEDEKAVFAILKSTYKEQKGEFEISKINSYAKNNYTQYSRLINQMVNKSRDSLYRQNLVDKANQKLYEKSTRAEGMYSLLLGAIKVIVISYIIGLLPILNRAYINVFGVGFEIDFLIIALVLLPLIATLLIKLKLNSKIQNKIAVLTQKGTEEREQWRALARFMEEFSLIEEKGVPDLVLWEKYLIFATAFGEATTVIEQMKAKYPEVFVEEYWENEVVEKYQVLNFATFHIIYNISDYNPISSINSSTNRAYSTSLSEIAAHSSSSGSGGGGGFSGGGRWPEAVADGMGRKIERAL